MTLLFTVKAKMMYPLTLQVKGYSLLALQSTTVIKHLNTLQAAKTPFCIPENDLLSCTQYVKILFNL